MNGVPKRWMGKSNFDQEWPREALGATWAQLLEEPKRMGYEKVEDALRARSSYRQNHLSLTQFEHKNAPL
jgi:hypothetical protein